MMSWKKIKQLFKYDTNVSQTTKCGETDFNFISASTEWRVLNEYSLEYEALIMKQLHQAFQSPESPETQEN